MTRYWIKVSPQDKEAHVCWFEAGFRPVWSPQHGHILAWHGPYSTGDEADAAIRTLFPDYWTLGFSGDLPEPPTEAARE